MSFTAKYRSECRDCEDGIHPGELIELDDDRAPFHVLCPDGATIDGKPRPVCGSCFLELPKSGKCEECFPDD